MTVKRAALSKKSPRLTKTSVDQPGQARKKPGVPARAHRDNTTEAKTQRSRTAKTHPTRNPVASRKPWPVG